MTTNAAALSSFASFHHSRPAGSFFLAHALFCLLALFYIVPSLCSHHRLVVRKFQLELLLPFPRPLLAPGRPQAWRHQSREESEERTAHPPRAAGTSQHAAVLLPRRPSQEKLEGDFSSKKDNTRTQTAESDKINCISSDLTFFMNTCHGLRSRRQF
jgi:hypothetical protein